METIILLTAGFLALSILFFKTRRLIKSITSDTDNGCSNCGCCSSLCSAREHSDTAADTGRK
jgi:hypothetical protein